MNTTDVHSYDGSVNMVASPLKVLCWENIWVQRMMLILVPPQLCLRPQQSGLCEQFLGCCPSTKTAFISVPLIFSFEKVVQGLGLLQSSRSCIATMLTCPLWGYERRLCCSWKCLVALAVPQFHVTYLPCKNRKNPSGKAKESYCLLLHSEISSHPSVWGSAQEKR